MLFSHSSLPLGLHMVYVWESDRLNLDKQKLQVF